MTAGNTLLSVWGPGTEKKTAEKAAVAKAVFEFLQWTCHKYAERLLSSGSRRIAYSDKLDIKAVLKCVALATDVVECGIRSRSGQC